MMSRRAHVVVSLLIAGCPPLPGQEPTATEATTGTGSTEAGSTGSTTDPTTGSTTDPTTSTTIDTVTVTLSTTEPPVPICGDGVLQPGEQCDDGNQEDADCCTNTCMKGQDEPGQVCWTVTVEGSDDGEDQGGGIAVDAAGEIYLTAQVVDMFAGPDALVRKLDPGGVSVWTQQYDGGINGPDTALRLAAEPSGFMVAVGRQTTVQMQPPVLWLSKCTPTGQIVWQFTDDAPIAGIAVALSGSEPVVVGSITQAGDTNGWVRKYDENGGTIWTKVHTGASGGVDTLSGVAVDAAGNVIAVGRESTMMQGFDILVRQYGPDGAPGWQDVVDGGMMGNDWALDAAVDPDGAVFVAGRVETGGGFSDAWLRKYSATGEPLWTGSYAGAFGGSEDATAIAATTGGGFVAAGSTAVGDDDNDLWIRRYSADGAEIWTDVVGGMDMGIDTATDVAFTPDGGVVVIGTMTVVDGLNSDAWVRKYGP
jgi:cysteine-rich repeat protein